MPFPPSEVQRTPARFLGADPGANGGIAVLEENGAVIDAIAVPEDDLALWELVSEYGNLGEKWGGYWQVYSCIEKVSGWTGGNKKIGKNGQPYKHDGQPANKVFVFGDNYGRLRMALVAAYLAPLRVPPQTWQKVMCPRQRAKGESKEAWKRYLKELAQELFPKVKVTLYNADALLIAEYCRRLHLY